MTTTTYTLLFCVSLTATYLAVRAGLLRTYSALFIGSLVNSSFFFLYAVSRNNELSHAVAVALALGIGFTALSTGLGNLFRSYVAQPAPTAAPIDARATSEMFSV